MKLCLVTPGSGWILDRIGESIAQAGGWPWLELGQQSDTALMHAEGACFTRLAEAEAVLFCDVQNCWGEDWRQVLPKAVHVGFFTHLDRDSVDAFRPHWDKLDGIVHMAQRYQRVFADQGWYPPERMCVIQPGAPCQRFKLRPLRLGVCQRGGFPGKGDPFLFEALAGLPANVRCCIELTIKGSGWQASLEAWRPKLSRIRIIVDEVEEAPSYEDFYGHIDYLLVPSLWEGGPMAVPEALASGVPVISADVGFVRDFLGDYEVTAQTGCFIFPPGDAVSLQRIISGIVEERIERRHRVEGLTWKLYAEKLEAFVVRLKGMRQ